MLAVILSSLSRQITKLRNLMAANSAPLAAQRLALVDFYPASDRLTIHFTLGGKARNMDRSGSEQLNKCLQRIQLNAGDKKQRGKKGVAPEAGPVAELSFGSAPVSPELRNSEAWRDLSLLRVGPEEFLVRVNLPRVLALSLPKYTIEGCPVVPQAQLSRCETRDCEWAWCRVEDQEFCQDTFALALSAGPTGLSEQLMGTFRLLKVSDQLVYSPAVADVGYRLLLSCQPVGPDKSANGLSCFAVSATAVAEFPRMEGQVDRFVGTGQPTSSQYLRVVSYNILADVWTNSKDCREVIYPHCSPLALDADYRQALTNRELIRFCPDIVCLQEVTRRRYTDFLMPAMECAGFLGHFAAKTGEMPEGEAILYRKDRFEAVDMYSLHSGEYMKIPENKELYNSLVLWGGEVCYHFLLLGTIFQICVLRDRSDPDRLFIVANTHLHSRPAVPFVRLFQAALLVRHAEALVEQYRGREGKRVSLLLCGDFNSNPENGLIEYLITGAIQADNEDWQPWASGVPTKHIFPGISLSHSLQLLSAAGQVPFTHFAGHFSATLDYIFCDSLSLSPYRVAPMPALWEVAKETALPNTWFPSDHVPIVCDLKIK